MQLYCNLKANKKIGKIHLKNYQMHYNEIKFIA